MNRASETKEKRRHVFRKCCHIFNITAVVLVLGVFLSIFSLGIIWNRNQKEMERFWDYGPATEQAIWVSAAEDIWLICQKEADAPYAEMSVYWYEEDEQWYSFSLDFLAETNVMRFVVTESEKTIFECRYKMKGTDEFYLYDFDLYNSEKEVPSFKNFSVTLIKRPYHETMTNMPFVLE